MRLILLSAVATLLFATCTAQQGNQELLKNFHTISSEEVYGYADTLSSTQFKGRLSGTPEYMDAANWVANHFKKWGVKPANESYFQMFNREYTLRESVGDFSATITEKDGTTITKTYSFPKDFLPGSNSGSGDINAEVVYVGYGITAKDLKYDEYNKVNVNGKVVIIESGTPYNGKDEAIIAKWKEYASVKYKIENAIAHGAKAILHVGLVAKPGYPFYENIVYAHVGEDVVAELFNGSNNDYKLKLEETKLTLKPFAVELKHKIRLSAQTKHFTDGKVCNVIGMIEGADPVLKNEVIILGAHLDGQGNPGALFAGALDNASGVANVMATARALSLMTEKPKRSILFILYGGEEEGLLGSGLYADNPLFAKEKTVCVVNMDMVGNGNGFVLTRVDNYPELKKHFVDANNSYLHRNLKTSNDTRGTGNPRTDGHLLYNRGYRAFGLWISGREKTLYYHHPYDTMETLTPEIMEDVAKWMFVSSYNIANDTELDITKLAE